MRVLTRFVVEFKMPGGSPRRALVAAPKLEEAVEALRVFMYRTEQSYPTIQVVRAIGGIYVAD